jgi:excinuclease UvrABC helicase subunit UvrB
MRNLNNIKSFNQFNENSNSKNISQISDDIEELEDIKNRYEKKGDFEKAKKTQDKIDSLKKEFKDLIKK